MSKNERMQEQVIRASQQLAMLATLLAHKLITEQDYRIVKDTIYRDYPVIVGIIS